MEDFSEKSLVDTLSALAGQSLSFRPTHIAYSSRLLAILWRNLSKPLAPARKARGARGRRQALKYRALPVTLFGCDYEYKTYGTGGAFASEGDLYESITGHRSEAIDEADKKRGGT